MHTFDSIPVVGATQQSIHPIAGDESIVFEFDWPTYTAQVGLQAQFGIRLDFQITSDVILEVCNSVYINNLDSPYTIWIFFPDVRQIVSCDPNSWINVPVYGGTRYAIMYVDTAQGVYPIEFIQGQLNPWTQVILSKQFTGTVDKAPPPYFISSASPNAVVGDARSIWFPPNRKARLYPVLGDMAVGLGFSTAATGIQNVPLPFPPGADINSKIVVIKALNINLNNASAVAVTVSLTFIIRNSVPPPVQSEIIAVATASMPATSFAPDAVNLSDVNLAYVWQGAQGGTTPTFAINVLNAAAGTSATVNLIYTLAGLEMA